MAAILAVLMLLLAPAARAGDFDLSARTDKAEVDLGDTLQFSLTLTVHGDLTFQPQLDLPTTFKGFDAQGPSESQSFSWVNGASTDVYTWTWTLEAQVPGRYTFGPYRATANDALNGRLRRATRPVVVLVRHPQGLGSTLASLAPTPSPQPTPPPPDAAALRGIRPDWGLPWGWVAAVYGGLLLVLGIAAGLSRGRRAPPKEEPLPADPVAAAYRRLDLARREFETGRDARGYAIRVGEALRLYLRQRLDLRPGLTLAEAVAALRGRAPQVPPGPVSDLRRRLELQLYAGGALDPEELGTLDAGARDVIRALEGSRRLTPAQRDLAKALDRMASVWASGQAKSGWLGMRSAAVEHIRKALALGPGPLPKAALTRMLRPMESPELARTLDSLGFEEPPRGSDPKAVAGGLLALAQALEAARGAVFDEDGPRDAGRGGPGTQGAD